MYTHKNNLTLKKIKHTDLNLLNDLKDESWFGTHKMTVVNADDQLRWYSDINWTNNYIFIAQDCALNSSKKVGLVKLLNIDWINRTFEMSYDVFADHRSQGFGKKVAEVAVDFGFEMLGLRRATAEVLENNVASQNCLKYAGFVEEGLAREAVYKSGEFLGSYQLGLLDYEWRQLPRVEKMGGLCNVSYRPKND